MRLSAFSVALLMMLVPLTAGCDRGDGSGDDDGQTGDAAPDPLPTGTLAIKGSLANGDTPANVEVLKNQKVDLFRNDATLIGTAQSDDAGTFTIALAPGALAIPGTGYSLQGEEAATDDADHRFYLQATVPDDGSGKALGIKRKIKLTQSAATSMEADTAIFDTGLNSLTEVSAITGTIKFADPATTVTATDVYIPGKSFFARTGDDGAFQLLYVPEGTYTIRIQKGVYIKQVDVTVAAGKTTKLGELTVASTDRNPLPLAQVILGKWNTTCFYSDSVGGVSPEDPVTGAIEIKALDDVDLISGDNCLLRTTMAAPEVFVSLSVPSDGSIISKFAAMGGTYYLNMVSGYTNDKITVVYNSYLLGGNAIEVFTRAP